jgi:hypothetical protein
MHDEYKYTQSRINNKRMEMYYDNMLKEEYTALGFPMFKNGDGLQQLVASLPHDQALTECELYTLEDMK